MNVRDPEDRKHRPGLIPIKKEFALTEESQATSVYHKGYGTQADSQGLNAVTFPCEPVGRATVLARFLVSCLAALTVLRTPGS